MFVPLTPLDFCRRAVRLYSGKIGVVDGEKRFTYCQFGERANRLANALLGLGIKKGDVVSFVCYNSYQLLEAYYGVVQAQAILNPINIRLTAGEIEFILDHAQSRVVCFHSDFRPLIQTLQRRLSSIRHFVEIEPSAPLLTGHQEYEDLLRRASTDFQAPEVEDENDIAELFYTSGTTGDAKGVVLSHRSLYLHALNLIAGLGYTDRERFLHVVPLFHVNGWGTPHTLTAVGGRHVMLRKFDPKEVFRLVQEEGITRLFAVPAVFIALLNEPKRGAYDLSSLRQVKIGGAPSSLSLIRQVEEGFGCQAIVGYGLTETSPVVSLALPKDHMLDWEKPARLVHQVRTGIEIIGSEIRVIGAEGRDVDPNDEEVGEIAIRSNVVMTGYYKDPDATSRAIRDGWFYSGDLATIDSEGSLRIVDRSKDIIISGGENISSAEVENALYSHPSVIECAVIGVPDETWGEVPVALVVCRAGREVTETELIAHIRGNLAPFKCPKAIHFRDSLPKGGTGKILKRQLREPFWQGKKRRVN
jgi:acyl-CoA synthetase (AMP-forming)/AMP-acid ligase II